MNFITVRDLKTQSAKVWQMLGKDHDLVLTNHGRPVAVIIETAGEDLERTLSDLKALRAMRAVERVQAKAKAQGLDAMTLDEINSEIKAVRQARAKKLAAHERRH